ncbi:MAG: hypothetical protein OXF79_00055 [Chloroflexi bacterium]|nr:hypothetical protein [Chloroflexota bacterium]
MDPVTSHIKAPAPRFIAQVDQSVEIAAFAKALPHVGPAAFHLGMTHLGQIGDETTTLGVFQNAPVQTRMERVRSRHRGGEIIDDHVAGEAVEKVPRRVQAGDNVLQLLAVRRPDEAMS